MILLGVTLLSPSIVFGQSSDPAAALKNIQENTLLPSLKEKAKVPEEGKFNDTKIYINKLHAVELDNDLIKNDVLDYWSSYQGKEITNQDINNFKEWAWNKFNQAGYFAFLYTEAKKTVDGEVLQIKISLPTIKEVKIYSKNEALARKYSEIIIARLGNDVLPGNRVDTLALEQKLEDAAFDLPVTMELNMRPVGSEQVQLVVNVIEREDNPGKFQYGAAQVNNYGLSQYGSIQGLGILAFNGLTPGSTLSLTAQGSQGLAYGRVEYDFPTELLAGHVRLWSESAYSRNIDPVSTATVGFTENYGLGMTHILGSQRDMTFRSLVDISQRSTVSSLINPSTQINSIVDNQIRFKLTADNLKLARTITQNYELSFVDGIDDQNGQYSFFTASGSIQAPLNKDGLSALFRFKAEAAPTRNLDTYNRISLGGVNGLRAYTTLDGVGDQGGLVSLEIRQQFLINHYVGAFYDVGVVQQNQNAVANQYNDYYTLQDLGLSFGGTFPKFSYTASVAKAIGDYAAYVPGTYQTSPGSWRINFSLTYPF